MSYYLEAPILYSFDGLAPLLGAESISAAAAMVASIAVYVALFVWAMRGEDNTESKRRRVWQRVSNSVNARLSKLSGKALFLWVLGTTASFPVEHWAWENIGPMATLATFLGVGTK